MLNDNQETHPIMGLVQELEGKVRVAREERDEWKSKFMLLLTTGGNPIPILIGVFLGFGLGLFFIRLWLMKYGC